MTTEQRSVLRCVPRILEGSRTWFVVYGIGGPVLLFTNDTFAKTVKASGEGKTSQLYPRWRRSAGILARA